MKNSFVDNDFIFPCHWKEHLKAVLKNLLTNLKSSWITVILYFEKFLSILRVVAFYILLFKSKYHTDRLNNVSFFFHCYYFRLFVHQIYIRSPVTIHKRKFLKCGDRGFGLYFIIEKVPYCAISPVCWFDPRKYWIFTNCYRHSHLKLILMECISELIRHHPQRQRNIQVHSNINVRIKSLLSNDNDQARPKKRAVPGSYASGLSSRI